AGHRRQDRRLCYTHVARGTSGSIAGGHWHGAARRGGIDHRVGGIAADDDFAECLRRSAFYDRSDYAAGAATDTLGISPSRSDNARAADHAGPALIFSLSAFPTPIHCRGHRLHSAIAIMAVFLEERRCPAWKGEWRW